MDSDWVTCPYNRSHRVSRSRIQIHLVKCEQRYPALAICPYNATHRMPRDQLSSHVTDCPSADTMKSDTSLVHLEDGVRSKKDTPHLNDSVRSNCSLPHRSIGLRSASELKQNNMTKFDPDHEFWD